MRVFLLLFVVIASVSCSNDQLTNQNPQVNTPPPLGSTIVVPSRAFRYSGYDSTGKWVVQGWLRFTPEQSTFKGKWELEAADEYLFGPQNGTGTLQGSSEQQGSSYRIGINLNYGRVDDNVELHGFVHGNEFVGTWTYGTLSGVVNSGNFYAIQQQ